MAETKLIALMLVRGLQKTSFVIKDTAAMLHITTKNTVVILEANPSVLGMIRKVKDYVTYGDIDAETLALLKEKRKDNFKEEGSVFKHSFALNPPVGGFERKGTKVGFTAGGALGNRKEKINDLLKKMI